jgi:hypothetical protein
MEEQGHRVLQAMAATLSPVPQMRSQGEEALAREAQLPHYGVVLASIAVGGARGGVAHELRQLGAVLLKNYVKAHWQEGERGFEAPQVGRPAFAGQAARREKPLGTLLRLLVVLNR